MAQRIVRVEIRRTPRCADQRGKHKTSRLICRPNMKGRDEIPADRRSASVFSRLIGGAFTVWLSVAVGAAIAPAKPVAAQAQLDASALP
jgi:hypothetical protein